MLFLKLLFIPVFAELFLNYQRWCYTILNVEIAHWLRVHSFHLNLNHLFL